MAKSDYKCPFKSGKVKIDYKNRKLLAKFLYPETGGMLPAKVMGVSAKYQRKLSTAIKRARFLGILPYVR